MLRVQAPLKGDSSPPKLAQDVRPWSASSSTTESANRNTPLAKILGPRSDPDSRAEGRSPAKFSEVRLLLGSRLGSVLASLFGKGSSVFRRFLTGQHTESCRPSSSSPRTLQPGRAALQHLEKHLLVWLWSGLAAEPAPSATSPSATSSTCCSSPKILGKDDKEPRCILAWCCPPFILWNSKNVCFLWNEWGEKSCPRCLKLLSRQFLQQCSTN